MSIHFMFPAKAVECGDPSANLTAQHLKLQSGSIGPTNYYSSPKVECDYAWFFEDGSDWYNMTCLGSSTWSTLFQCIGKT